MKIYLTDDKLMPIKGSDGAAAFDLKSNERFTLLSNNRVAIDTGVALELPKNKCALILPRSGLAFKEGITVLNTPGLIDSDYRNYIKVILHNSGKLAFKINKYDRIAQLLIVDIKEIKFTKVNSLDKLSKTKRDKGGLGSTGIK